MIVDRRFSVAVGDVLIFNGEECEIVDLDPEGWVRLIPAGSDKELSAYGAGYIGPHRQETCVRVTQLRRKDD